MRALAAAFAFVYGSGLVLLTVQALALSVPDPSGASEATAIAASVLVSFVYPVGMDPVWWLALVLLALASRRGGPSQTVRPCNPPL